MKQSLGGRGYTVVEVMIVLAISGVLLSSISAMISGQQRNTEFSLAVRDAESKFQDVINDVESGVFNNNGKLSCNSTYTDTEPTMSVSSTAEQGTNSNCIYLGKVIEFYPNAIGELTAFKSVGIAGKQQYESAPDVVDEVTSIRDAGPVAFWDPTLGADNPIATDVLRNGLRLKNITYYNNVGVTLGTSSAFVVIGPLGIGGQSGGISGGPGTNNSSRDGGARILSIFPAIADADPFALTSSLVGQTSNLDNVFTDVAGVVICLNDGGKRPAVVAIGLQPKADGTNGIESSGQRNKTNAYLDQDADRMGCTAP